VTTSTLKKVRAKSTPAAKKMANGDKKTPTPSKKKETKGDVVTKKRKLEQATIEAATEDNLPKAESKKGKVTNAGEDEVKSKEGSDVEDTGNGEAEDTKED
jgi:hypothetical protein